MSVVPIERRQSDAFAAYAEAKARVDASGSLDDAMAAGRAWRRFLDTFMTAEQREALDAASVVSLRRRS